MKINALTLCYEMISRSLDNDFTKISFFIFGSKTVKTYVKQPLAYDIHG